MNIIDTHTDTITTLMDANEHLYKNNQHISIENLLAYDKKGIYFSIWLNKKRRETPYLETKKAIEFYYKELLENEHYITHCNSFSEFNNAFQNNKIASILCLEGGEAIEDNIDNLYRLHDMGVRLLTLTWNNDNNLGSGVLGADRGLTNFGRVVIKKSNELNLIIDISHLNKKGFFNVIDLTNKPIIASHSNVFNIHNSKRNLDDECLLELKNTKSYVSVTIHSPFIDGNEKTDIEKLLPHIDYLLNKLGEDFISIGTDFDGTNLLPKKINNISNLKSLYNLLKTTYNTDIANKIFYQNQLNFLKSVL